MPPRGRRVATAVLAQALTAARAAEQAHYEVLTGAGAQPLTLTFTIPNPAIVTDVPTFLTTLVTLEEAFIAAYLAAAQEFVVLGEAGLAQLALQIGAVEAEHRAGVRFFAIQDGVLSGVPNDVAFEQALFATVGEAAALQELGFIGGGGTAVTYPGPGEIDASGVTNTEPNGPVVSCAQGFTRAQGGGGRGGRDDGMTMPSVGVGSASRAADGRALGALDGLAGVGAAALAMRARRVEPAVTEEA